MSPSTVDLRELALERPSQRKPHKKKRRSILARYVVPGLILAGFGGLMFVALRDWYLPRKPVSVVPVVMAKAEVRQEGTPLFQAAGWVEPRPTPYLISTLAEGVVEELLVVEGQEVKKDDPVARLIDLDSKLAVREAQATLDLREAESQSIQAELKAAQLRVQHPVHLEAELAQGQAQSTQKETELGKLPYLIAAAQAKVDFARKNLEGKQQAKSSLSERVVEQAVSELAAAEAELEELQNRGTFLKKELAALQQQVEALRQRKELLIEENQALEDARAKLLAAKARRDQAQVALEKAELDLKRMVVRSPIDGRILQLVAAPGTRVLGLGSGSGENSSTVVSLYNPQMLQVRADVRLEDVPQVTPGQPVLVETASFAEPIPGVVLLPTSSANIQKNTLEVKVALTNPPPAIRPEMLVTATFLAPPLEKSDEEISEDPDRMLVPRQLVEKTESGSMLWIVDHEGLARRRMVQLGKAGTEELVEVVQGINPTDKLISSGQENLQEGDRVEITSEDQSLGMNTN